jgi:hypothetical protein
MFQYTTGALQLNSNRWLLMHCRTAANMQLMHAHFLLTCTAAVVWLWVQPPTLGADQAALC